MAKKRRTMDTAKSTTASKLRSLWPPDFIGRTLKSDLSDVSVEIARGCAEEAPVYVLRLAPEETGEWDKIAEYGDAGARAYELYVITDGHIITDVNHRVQQLPCSGRSFAPHGAPAWMFPDEAMFDIEWSDLASSAQREMIATLKAMVSG